MEWHKSLLEAGGARGPQDRVELLMGLGEALYFDDAFAAASWLFEAALATPSLHPAAGRERLFDWWASAVDRHAQSLASEFRSEVYARLLDGALAELRRPSLTPTALYRQVAALGALGRAADAYDAAQAAWIRAGFTADGAGGVRADLDRLVREGVIPDRSRGAAVTDAGDLAGVLRADWERFKTAWTVR
jgi:hypothetical protein